MKALKFEGSGSEYFSIWIVNILLTIVTLGLYYPWAKVRNRRYFYANSTLDNRNFEYHATGMQLFLAFVVAMMLLIAYIALERISPQFSIAMVGILFLATPWIIWRSMMFRMRMSSFSNVRFSFAGSLSKSYKVFMILPILLLLAFVVMVAIAGFAISSNAAINSPITIGLFALISISFFLYVFSFLKKKSTEYMFNGLRYGQGEFYTDINIMPLLMIRLKAIVLSLVFVIAFAGLVGGILLSVSSTDFMSELSNIQEVFATEEQEIEGIFDESTKLTPENTKEPMELDQDDSASHMSPEQSRAYQFMFLFIGLFYLIMLISSLFIIAFITARERRYIFENLMLDDKISFESTLKARSLVWVMFTNLLGIILSFGLALPWAKVRMARLHLENTWVDTEFGFNDYISQKQQEQSSLGDQIGEAFDMDVGF